MAVNDFWYENLKDKGITEGGVSYYITRAKDIKEMENGKLAIPQTSAIFNCFYLPYLDGESSSWVIGTALTDEAKGNILPVSVNNLKSPDGVKYGETVRTRLLSIPDDLKDVELGSCHIFDKSGCDIGGNFKWQNEGKLHFYPYTYLQYNDNISNPITIYPQYVDNPTEAKIKVRHALNIQGQYLLYVNSYRGDTTGFSSGVLTEGISIPTASNPYVDWYMANQNQIQNQRNMNAIGIVGGLVGGAVTVGASALTGNAIGVLGGVGQMTSGFINSAKYEMTLASQERDSQNQPSSVQNTSGNSAFFRQLASGGIEHGLRENRYRYNDADMTRIATYFHQYGYAQNKLMQPSFKGRKYWNYLQTSDCHLKVPNCPKEHLQQLKAIFDSGVTVWHKANGDMFENMDKDNVEI